MSTGNEIKPGKPSPSLAPAYCAIYPDMAVLVRKHGYALSIHGSLRRDFDLVCIPWADTISTPDEVVGSIIKEFGFTRDKYPTQKNHGRICYTIHISWGECRFDLSFVLQPSSFDHLDTVRECARLIGLWWETWVQSQPNPMYYREAHRLVENFPSRLMDAFPTPTPSAKGGE